MTNETKKDTLAQDKIDALLTTADTACLATINADGSPYVIPVHFVYYDDAVFVHCRLKGQKISNIMADARVSMTVFSMGSFEINSQENPCKVNTMYESVVLSGTALLVENFECKRTALAKIVKKYTPQLASKEMSDKAIGATAVIRIDIQSLTSKHYG